eukprot:2937218-Pleurochrysis_carterae.AAC.1
MEKTASGANGENGIWGKWRKRHLGQMEITASGANGDNGAVGGSYVTLKARRHLDFVRKPANMHAAYPFSACAPARSSARTSELGAVCRWPGGTATQRQNRQSPQPSSRARWGRSW